MCGRASTKAAHTHEASSAVVPRNVVTLVPRRLVLPTRTNRERRERVLTELERRYRLRREANPTRVEIDFAKRVGRAAAKAEVVAALDGIDRRWRWLFACYPRDDAAAAG